MHLNPKYLHWIIFRSVSDGEQLVDHLFASRNKDLTEEPLLNMSWLQLSVFHGFNAWLSVTLRIKDKSCRIDYKCLWWSWTSGEISLPGSRLAWRGSCHVAVLFAVAMFQNMMLDLPSPLMPRHWYCTSTIKLLTVERGPKQLFAFINISTWRGVRLPALSNIYPSAQNISRSIMTTWTLCSRLFPNSGTWGASSCLCNVALTSSAIQPGLWSRASPTPGRLDSSLLQMGTFNF